MKQKTSYNSLRKKYSDQPLSTTAREITILKPCPTEIEELRFK